MLVERYNQYKTAAIKAKQAGNNEVAVRYIRTAKVIVGLTQAFICLIFTAIYYNCLIAVSVFIKEVGYVSEGHMTCPVKMLLW